MKERPSSSGLDKGTDDPFSRQSESARDKKLLKTSPRSTSPPPTMYAQYNAVYTPDHRGGKLFKGLAGTSPPNYMVTSPFPDRSREDGRRHFTEAAAAGTPGGPALLGAPEYHDKLYTPLISRQMPKLAPPSTAHLPSQFVAMSSPAPFWKYAAELASSPVKGFISSPVKAEKVNGVSDEAEEDDDKSNNKNRYTTTKVQSSSPPPAEGEVGQGSPTKALSTRGRESKDMTSRGQAPTPPQNTGDNSERQQQQSQHNRGRSNSGTVSRGLGATMHGADDEEEEEEEEGGLIDLAKGFQTIGAFHSSMNAQTAGPIRGN